MRARQTPHGPHKRSVCICDRGGSNTSFLPFLKRAAFFPMTRRVQTAYDEQNTLQVPGFECYEYQSYRAMVARVRFTFPKGHGRGP